MSTIHVDLKPGFNGFISVEEESGKIVYKKKIGSSQEGADFIKKYGESIPGSGLLKASVIPIRTNSWKDLSKNLFLPTFVNYALKADNIFMKLFESIFAIPLDILTFVP